MRWAALGFNGDPFETKPITEATLDLYTGNQDMIRQCQFTLQSDNAIIVVEGARGVGTTSFANYLRFSAQAAKDYFTPINEIRVEPNWNAETLFAAIISNIVSTLELQHRADVKDNAKFKQAKQVIAHVTETYRSFGASVFGFGANYGTSGSMSQPMIIPTQMLAQHLENLVGIVKKLGYKYGLLVQLNNLDIGTVQLPDHLKMVLNILRDYFQMAGTSWLLVGDVDLRRFIAQHVDRLDDIISYETIVTALSEKDYLALIERRIKYYRAETRIKLPVDNEVWLYLHHITKGRLRYIFGLMSRLCNSLQLGTLTDRITLELAKPLITNYAQQRVQRFRLTATEEAVLKLVVQHDSIQVNEIADKLEKKSSQISNILSQLQSYKLVGYRKEWRSHYYYPAIDAMVAYCSASDGI